jgi:hypothetical protein
VAVPVAEWRLSTKVKLPLLSATGPAGVGVAVGGSLVAVGGSLVAVGGSLVAASGVGAAVVAAVSSSSVAGCGVAVASGAVGSGSGVSVALRVVGVASASASAAGCAGVPPQADSSSSAANDITARRMVIWRGMRQKAMNVCTGVCSFLVFFAMLTQQPALSIALLRLLCLCKNTHRI